MAEIINFFEKGKPRRGLILFEYHSSHQSLSVLLCLTKTFTKRPYRIGRASPYPLTKVFTFHGKVASPSIGRNRSRGVCIDKRRALQLKRVGPFMIRLSLSTSYNRPQEQHWVKILNILIEWCNFAGVVLFVSRFLLDHYSY